MHAGVVTYTRRNAQPVASALKALTNNPAIKYIKLTLSTTLHATGRALPETRDSEVWVGFYEDPEKSIVSLADGRELFRLKTNEGKRLDIIFGRPADRDMEPALVLIEAD